MRNSLEKEGSMEGAPEPNPGSKFYSIEPETAPLEYIYYQFLVYKFLCITCKRWGLRGEYVCRQGSGPLPNLQLFLLLSSSGKS